MVTLKSLMSMQEFGKSLKAQNSLEEEERSDGVCEILESFTLTWRKRGRKEILIKYLRKIDFQVQNIDFVSICLKR